MSETFRVVASIKKELKMVGISSFIINTLFQPLLYLFIFGTLLGKLISEVKFGSININYYTYIFPGILTINGFLIGIRAGATITLEKNNGGLETAFSLPVSRGILYMSKILASFIQSFIGFGVLFLVGYWFMKGVSLGATEILGIFIVYSCITVITASLMIFLSSSIRNPELPVAIANIIFLPLMMFSNVFYPATVVNENPILYSFIIANPMSQANIIMRTYLFGLNKELTLSWIYIVGLMTIFCILGLNSFTKIMNKK